jgi:hypothetical protein
MDATRQKLSLFDAFHLTDQIYIIAALFYQHMGLSGIRHSIFIDFSCFPSATLG